MLTVVDVGRVQHNVRFVFDMSRSVHGHECVDAAARIDDMVSGTYRTRTGHTFAGGQTRERLGASLFLQLHLLSLLLSHHIQFITIHIAWMTRGTAEMPASPASILHAIDGVEICVATLPRHVHVYFLPLTGLLTPGLSVPLNSLVYMGDSGNLISPSTLTTKIVCWHSSVLVSHSGSTRR